MGERTERGFNEPRNCFLVGPQAVACDMMWCGRQPTMLRPSRLHVYNLTRFFSCFYLRIMDCDAVVVYCSLGCGVKVRKMDMDLHQVHAGLFPCSQTSILKVDSTRVVLRQDHC